MGFISAEHIIRLASFASQARFSCSFTPRALLLPLFPHQPPTQHPLFPCPHFSYLKLQPQHTHIAAYPTTQFFPLQEILFLSTVCSMSLWCSTYHKCPCLNWQVLLSISLPNSISNHDVPPKNPKITHVLISKQHSTYIDFLSFLPSVYACCLLMLSNVWSLILLSILFINTVERWFGFPLFGIMMHQISNLPVPVLWAWSSTPYLV